MIPYFSWTTITVGPLTLYVWGLFVAAGIGIGVWLAVREAWRRGLDVGVMTDLALWALLGAFVVARLVHVVAYAPAHYAADPAKILAVWEGGLSSFGGFLGAALGAAAYVWYRRVPFFAYAECAAYALPLGYGCGRIGCFLIHDHPGTLSQSFLAVQYPGGSRLDHGLLLSLLGFGIFGLFWVLHWRGYGKDSVFFLPMSLLLYGSARFVLDFYRAWDIVGADTRYWLLTPAQYGSVIFVVVGVWLSVRRPRIAK